MKHGKIKDIDALKKAVQRFKKQPIEMSPSPAYWNRSKCDVLPCSYVIYRRDTCGGHVVAVVINTDGSYHLEWGTDNREIDQNILRAVKIIMALYKEEVQAKEKSYDEQETERQNQILAEKAQEKEQHIKA